MCNRGKEQREFSIVRAVISKARVTAQGDIFSFLHTFEAIFKEEVTAIAEKAIRLMWGAYMPSPGLCGSSMHVLLVADSKLAIGVSVSLNDCLSSCVSPAIDCRPVQDKQPLAL